jgi:hypothetical protein
MATRSPQRFGELRITGFPWRLLCQVVDHLHSLILVGYMGHKKTGWWFVFMVWDIFYFSIYWECHHPN